MPFHGMLPTRRIVIRASVVVSILVALALGAKATQRSMIGVARAEADAGRRSPPREPEEKVARIGSDVILLPPSIAFKIDAKTVVVEPAVRGRRLPPFQGCLSLDNNRMARVRSRFAGEIVSTGLVRESSGDRAERPLRCGDRVEKNQVLAVAWGKDLGEKKSEYIDALSKLDADGETLTRIRALYQDGATAERTLREMERTVLGDRIAAEKAERTLRSWRLTDPELDSVRNEARGRPIDGRSGDGSSWARFEIRAPLGGILLEKNVAVGDFIDTTGDLFKIGDLSELVVWANVYEEDLATLQGIPTPVPWEVSLPSRPDAVFTGIMEQVGAVIDPNQHTALASGRVGNKTGALKIGQFVTASVECPPNSGELLVPAAAVVEDGRDSAVFVQVSNDPHRFRRQAVKVVRRGRDELALRCEADGLRSGAVVLASGALFLQDALTSLPAPAAQP